MTCAQVSCDSNFISIPRQAGNRLSEYGWSVDQRRNRVTNPLGFFVVWYDDRLGLGASSESNGSARVNADPVGRSRLCRATTEESCGNGTKNDRNLRSNVLLALGLCVPVAISSSPKFLPGFFLFSPSPTEARQREGMIDCMKRIERLFRNQNGVCPWCGYTMLLGWYSVDIREVDAAATIDHLVPKTNGQKRPAVAAHKVCNNERGHRASVSPNTIASIEKSVVQYGLTKNNTAANMIWEQKIRRFFKTLPEPALPEQMVSVLKGGGF